MLCSTRVIGVTRVLLTGCVKRILNNKYKKQPDNKLQGIQDTPTWVRSKIPRNLNLKLRCVKEKLNGML